MIVDEILRSVSHAVPAGQTVYLVGGALRDRILGRPAHDLDFVTQADTRQLAKSMADSLGAGFYPLDEERGTYRVISDEKSGNSVVLDFALLRGPDLVSDLKARDFTLNAMAVEISTPDEVIDPCGGRADLAALILRACGPTNVLDDPVRALRGLRMATLLGLQIEADTQAQITQAAGLLERISAERLRDEFFRILDGPKTSEAVYRFDQAGLIQALLPELVDLKGMVQSPPHVYEGWTHTLMVVQRLEELWGLLVDGTLAEGADPADSAIFEMARSELGRFQISLQAYFAAKIVPLRSLRTLLFFAGLYHDCAKPITRSVEPTGRIRFFDHDQLGAEIAARRARFFALSNLEIERIEKVIQGHMRIHQMADDGKSPSARTIYRFFRDTDPGGIEICLLSLADTWATRGPGLSAEHWLGELRVCQALFTAYWERREEVVAPPRLITGHDLIQVLGMQPGQRIGRILEAVREGQAVGQVTDREGALNLARDMLNEVGFV